MSLLGPTGENDMENIANPYLKIPRLSLAIRIAGIKYIHAILKFYFEFLRIILSRVEI